MNRAWTSPGEMRRNLFWRRFTRCPPLPRKSKKKKEAANPMTMAKRGRGQLQLQLHVRTCGSKWATRRFPRSDPYHVPVLSITVTLLPRDLCLQASYENHAAIFFKSGCSIRGFILESSSRPFYAKSYNTMKNKKKICQQDRDNSSPATIKFFTPRTPSSSQPILAPLDNHSIPWLCESHSQLRSIFSVAVAAPFVTDKSTAPSLPMSRFSDSDTNLTLRLGS